MNRPMAACQQKRHTSDSSRRTSTTARDGIYHQAISQVMSASTGQKRRADGLSQSPDLMPCSVSRSGSRASLHPCEIQSTVLHPLHLQPNLLRSTISIPARHHPGLDIGNNPTPTPYHAILNLTPTDEKGIGRSDSQIGHPDF